MQRKFTLRIALLSAFLTCSAAVFAQAHANAASQPGANTNVIVMPAAPSVYVVAGGIYGTGVYVTSPATLPVQNTGISLGSQAGISLQGVLQSGAATELPSPGFGYMSPAYGGYPATGAVPETGRLIQDMAPSYYAGAVSTQAASMSLGEVSAWYKAHRSQNVRMYTNADAERISK